MGQQITVTVRAGASPSVRIFDLNRSLTGMALERYADVNAVTGDRPPDVLARRLLPLGVRSMTAYSSTVVLDAPPERWAELEPVAMETIENLFGYYGDDAGWSPDSLRAIGVEPVAAPEPTG